MPKLQEAPRPKSHWDYLLEEMQWMATDFAQERRWKLAAAKKVRWKMASYVAFCVQGHDRWTVLYELLEKYSLLCDRKAAADSKELQPGLLGSGSCLATVLVWS